MILARYSVGASWCIYRWYGTGMVFAWCWYGIGVALVLYLGGIGVVVV